MDLWILQAARVRQRTTSSESSRRSLDTLIGGAALAEHAAEGLDPSLAFALRLARALLGCGMPSHRVEEALERVADALGLDVDAFCTPTAMIMTLAHRGATRPEDVRTRVVRVEPGTTDLERLSALHDLVGRVERKELTPGDAALRVETILAQPPRYGDVASATAYALVSASSAVLLGAGSLDVPIACGLGLIVGVLEAIARRVPTMARLLPATCALTVSFLASVLAWQGVPLRSSVVLLAGIVVLLPGLTVTTATIELATANLVAGTARMMAGFVTFLQIAFGIALGRGLAHSLPEIAAAPVTAILPGWTLFAAAVVSAAAFTVLLRAKPRDARWVLLSVAIALAISRSVGSWIGAELAAFTSALAVASVSHAFARWMDRPIALMLTPGILFLVPGSIGFLSLRSLLDDDIEGGVTTAFRMALVAMALAAGVLVATAAIPPRKAL